MADDATETRNAGPQLTHSQAVNRCRELDTEIQRLSELDTPTAEEESRFAEAVAEFEDANNWRKHLERQAARAQVRSVVDGDLRTASTRFGQPSIAGKVEAGGSFDTMDRDAILEPDSVEDARFRSPWKLDEMRTFGRSAAEVAAEYRARALSAVGKMPAATDQIRKAATDLIERWDDEDARLSRLALTLSEPSYLRAWSKLARDPMAANLDADDRAAIDRVKTAARALSLTDANGGYLVPFQLDPTVIITANGSLNQIRSVARQVVATGDVWHGVSAGSVSWSYAAEAAEVGDNSPTFGQPTVEVHKAHGFVPISLEALADAANITQEVGRLLAFGKDVLEASAFVTGSGSGQPTGIVTALAAAGGSVIVSSASADTFALADVYALHDALPARYRGMPSAAWMANNLLYSKIRQFDTAGGAGLWATIGDGTPDRLLNKRVIEAETMDGTYGSGDNYVGIFGDFDNYVIADRVGATVEFIPQLFGPNQRPTGQRGWYAYLRHGANAVNPGAFRMLNVT